MLSRSSLNRSALTCLGIFIADFAAKVCAPDFKAGILPPPGKIFAYANFRAVVEALPNGTVLPNMGLALFALVVGAVFVAVAMASSLFLPQRLRAWPVGLGFLAGGFFGNAVDRAIHGSVANVFVFQTEPMGLSWGAFNFNVATLGEMIGAALLVFGFLRGMAGDWRPERRRRVIIERGYQMRFCFALQAAMTCGFVPMFLSSLLIFYSTKSRPDGAFVFLFIATAFLSYLALSIMSLTVGMALSHRTAGAILRFSRVATERLAGRRARPGEPSLSLRKHDEFQRRLISVMAEIDRCVDLVHRLTLRPKPPGSVRKNG